MATCAFDPSAAAWQGRRILGSALPVLVVQSFRFRAEGRLSTFEAGNSLAGGESTETIHNANLSTMSSLFLTPQLPSSSNTQRKSAKRVRSRIPIAIVAVIAAASVTVRAPAHAEIWRDYVNASQYVWPATGLITCTVVNGIDSPRPGTYQFSEDLGPSALFPPSRSPFKAQPYGLREREALAKRAVEREQYLKRFKDADPDAEAADASETESDNDSIESPRRGAPDGLSALYATGASLATGYGISQVVKGEGLDGGSFPFPSLATTTAVSSADLMRRCSGDLTGAIFYGLAATVGHGEIASGKRRMIEMLGGVAIGQIVNYLLLRSNQAKPPPLGFQAFRERSTMFLEGSIGDIAYEPNDATFTQGTTVAKWKPSRDEHCFCSTFGLRTGFWVRDNRQAIVIDVDRAPFRPNDATTALRFSAFDVVYYAVTANYHRVLPWSDHVDFEYGAGVGLGYSDVSVTRADTGSTATGWQNGGVIGQINAGFLFRINEHFGFTTRWRVASLPIDLAFKAADGSADGTYETRMWTSQFSLGMRTGW